MCAGGTIARPWILSFVNDRGTSGDDAAPILRRQLGYDGELSPAQWMALRFFARANSFSRTPSAFAEFQATTRGTASQAIKALEAGGDLVRQRSEADWPSGSPPLTNHGNK